MAVRKSAVGVVDRSPGPRLAGGEHVIERIRARQMARNHRRHAEHTAGGGDGEELLQGMRLACWAGAASEGDEGQEGGVRCGWCTALRETSLRSGAPPRRTNHPPPDVHQSLSRKWKPRDLGIAG